MLALFYSHINPSCSKMTMTINDYQPEPEKKKLNQRPKQQQQPEWQRQQIVSITIFMNYFMISSPHYLKIIDNDLHYKHTYLVYYIEKMNHFHKYNTEYSLRGRGKRIFFAPFFCSCSITTRCLSICYFVNFFRIKNNKLVTEYKSS